MNDAVSQHLIDMVAQYGRSLCDDPKRLSALLADLAPEDALERVLLKMALEAGAARQLHAGPPGHVTEAVLAQLAGGVARDYGVTTENARWAVDSWALALGMQLPTAGPVSAPAMAARAGQRVSPPAPAETGPAAAHALTPITPMQPAAAKTAAARRPGGNRRRAGYAIAAIIAFCGVIVGIVLLINYDATAAAKQSKAAGVRTNPKDGAALVYIPAGPFLMGDGDQSDNPRHTVVLSAYWMYKNDVTVAEYRRFCHATGRQMPLAPSFDPNWSQSDHPIVNVSWDDASAYAAWAGAALPTEAQWEKAARGTDGRLYPWGNTFDRSKLWCDQGSDTAVGVYAISPYGCSDMAGNVWQWCQDWYDPDFMKGRAAVGPDPDNQSNNSLYARVLRGGSWYSYFDSYFRASARNGNVPANVSFNSGFRCAVRVDSG